MASFYQQLFMAQELTSPEDLTQFVPCMVTEAMNEMLGPVHSIRSREGHVHDAPE